MRSTNICTRYHRYPYWKREQLRVLVVGMNQVFTTCYLTCTLNLIYASVGLFCILLLPAIFIKSLQTFQIFGNLSCLVRKGNRPIGPLQSHASCEHPLRGCLNKISKSIVFHSESISLNFLLVNILYEYVH
jgi:hypothetical protein